MVTASPLITPIQAPALPSSNPSNLIKKKTIVLDTSKSSDANENLANFLLWQVKTTKTCQEAEREFSLCRLFNRGSGSYCGNELTALYECLKQG